jgi:hypothetical protein
MGYHTIPFNRISERASRIDLLDLTITDAVSRQGSIGVVIGSQRPDLPLMHRGSRPASR